MGPYKRQTIDSLGTRHRARSYVDSYVPKISPQRVLSDISIPQSSPSRQDINLFQKEAIKKATQLAAPKPTTKTVLPIVSSVTESPHRNFVTRPKTLKPDLVNHVVAHTQKSTTQPVVLADLVNTIQSTQRAKQDNYRLDANGDAVEKQGFKTANKEIVGRMFATHRSIALSAASIFLFLGGGVALVSAFTTNHNVNTQVKALSDKVDLNESLGVSDSDEGLPSEEEVPEAVVNAYRPPADEPRYISIPKLKNKKTRVLKMGVGKDGAVQTPRTTWDTGWFSGSQKPGEDAGASLIVGHVSGPTTGGVFYNLYRLTENDEIFIETGDGTKYTYKVVSKEEVPLGEINMNNYMISKNIDKPGLTLMTCAGEYNPITQTYENRLAVFAVRVN